MALKFKNKSNSNQNDFVFLSSLTFGDFIVPVTNRLFTVISVIGIGTQAINGIKAAMVNIATTAADCQIDIESPLATKVASVLIRAGRGFIFHIFTDNNIAFNLVIRNNTAGGTIAGSNAIHTVDTPTEVSENIVSVINFDQLWNEYETQFAATNSTSAPRQRIL